MSDYLTRVIKSHLETHPDTSAASIERDANVPRSTISNIYRGHLPAPERLAQILAAIDDATARDWLTAYLRDHTPEQWLNRTRITVDPAQSTIQETVVPYLAQPKDKLTIAMEQLHSACKRDDEAAEWVIQTVALMFGEPQVPAGYAVAKLDGFTADEAALIRASAQKEKEQSASDNPENTAHKPKSRRK